MTRSVRLVVALVVIVGIAGAAGGSPSSTDPAATQSKPATSDVATTVVLDAATGAVIRLTTAPH